MSLQLFLSLGHATISVCNLSFQLIVPNKQEEIESY